MGLNINHSRLQSGTAQQCLVPGQGLLPAGHQQYADLTRAAGYMLLNLEVQCRIFKGIGQILLGLQPDMKLQIFPAQPRLHLKGFTYDQRVRHRHDSITGLYPRPAQCPEQRLCDTFRIRAGLIICTRDRQRLNGICLQPEPAVRTAQFDDFYPVRTDVDSHISLAGLVE